MHALKWRTEVNYHVALRFDIDALNVHTWAWALGRLYGLAAESPHWLRRLHSSTRYSVCVHTNTPTRRPPHIDLPSIICRALWVRNSFAVLGPWAMPAIVWMLVMLNPGNKGTYRQDSISVVNREQRVRAFRHVHTYYVCNIVMLQSGRGRLSCSSTT